MKNQLGQEIKIAPYFLKDYKMDITNVGDTWNKTMPGGKSLNHKVGGPFTKEELNKASIYVQHMDLLFDKATATNLSKNASLLIHHLLLKHPDQRAITYKEFYEIRWLTNKPFPFGPKLRRELEEKGFITSHEDVGRVGEVGQSVGDICEFTFITEAIPCG